MNNVDMSQLQFWGNKIEIIGKELDDIYVHHLIRDDFENFMSSFDLIVAGYKQRDILQSIIPEYGKLSSRVLELSDVMIDYALSVMELEENAADSFKTEDLENIPKFGDAIQAGNITANYNEYDCYQYVDEPYIFSEEYNDGARFAYSDTYRKCSWYWGFTEISKYKNYFKCFFDKDGFTDDYADKILEDTVESILDNAPGSVTTDLVSSDAMYEDINAYLNIDNFEDIFKTFLKHVKEAKAIGKSMQEFKKSSVYKEIIKLLGNPNAVKAFDSWISGILTSSALAEGTSTAIELLDNTTFVLNLFYRFFFDYTAQLDYIDTIQVSLLEAGYPAYQLNECLAKVRTEYDDAMTNFMNNIFEVATDKLEDKVEDFATTVITELVPDLKAADLTLKIISGTVKVVAGDEASAAQTFAGTQMCTNVLVDTYEYYMSLARAGRATPEDIKKADTLFRVIREAKIKEYTAMQTMVGEKSSDYIYYGQKIEELKGMGK